MGQEVQKAVGKSYAAEIGGVGSALGVYEAIQGNKRIEEAMAGARLESERLQRRVLGQAADVKLARERQAARDVGTLRVAGITGGSQTALLRKRVLALAQQALLDRRATEGQLAAIESRYGAMSQRQVANPWMAAVRGGAEGAMIGAGFKKA
jgi:hypothetical protein